MTSGELLVGTRGDLWWPATLRLGAGLAAALLVIALVTWRRVRRDPGAAYVATLSTSSLFVRWRTWAMITPVWLAAVVSPIACVALVVVLSVVAVCEYARLVALTPVARRLLLGVALLSGPLAALDFTSWRALPPLLLLAATVPSLLAQDVEEGASRVAFTALGLVYLPYLLTFVWLLREHTPAGAGMLLVVGVAVALSDVGAFTVGSWVGGGPLAARLSPNKTRGGVLGNLVGAAAGVAWTSFAVPGLPRWLLVGIPVVVAVGAVWGDLLESLLKRQFAAKDAGSWLPGFGGLLDRVDSLLVVAPLSYTWVVVAPRVVPG